MKCEHSVLKLHNIDKSDLDSLKNVITGDESWVCGYDPLNKRPIFPAEDAVSYTHLDVYKRQPLVTPSFSSSTLEMRALLAICLLYTSRCV